MTAEDDRAKEFRRMMVARERNALRNERALRGDPTAYRAFIAKWQPLIDALRGKPT